MSRYRVLADIAEDQDQVQIRTDWSEMPDGLREAALDALGRHLGVEGEPMRKGRRSHRHGPEVPDPRFGELTVLIEQARDDWQGWGRILTRRVLELLDEGVLLPLTAGNELVLRQLFSDHRQALLVGVLGADPSARLHQLEVAGLLSPEIAARGGYTELAYRLGKGLDTLQAHLRPIPERPVTLAAALQEALRPQLTDADRHAIAWAQTRAGALITRAVARTETDVILHLNDQAQGSIRQVVAAHVEGGGVGNLKRDLEQALVGQGPIGDADRIVRTELANAYGYGAYRSLKERAAAIGDHDPQVYRVASVSACEHCLRIWGPPTAPKIYRLSVIERREAAGGNLATPAAQWGPVFGAVHPNCACSPVAYYRPEIEDAIKRATAAVLKTFGRF